MPDCNQMIVTTVFRHYPAAQAVYLFGSMAACVDNLRKELSAFVTLKQTYWLLAEALEQNTFTYFLDYYHESFFLSFDFDACSSKQCEC